jgi:hypothetical protein
LIVLLCGCGGGGEVSSVSMGLSAGSGLDPAAVKSVEVLVLGGDRASCARALEPNSPLDDPELTVVRHALFAVDGTAKHLGGVPANQHLVFYAEAFATTDGQRPYIGRGCWEGELNAGASEGVTIIITAASAN